MLVSARDELIKFSLSVDYHYAESLPEAEILTQSKRFNRSDDMKGGSAQVLRRIRAKECRSKEGIVSMEERLLMSFMMGTDFTISLKSQS